LQYGNLSLLARRFTVVRFFDEFVNFSSHLVASHPAADTTVRMPVPGVWRSERSERKSDTRRYCSVAILVIFFQQALIIAHSNSDNHSNVLPKLRQTYGKGKGQPSGFGCLVVSMPASGSRVRTRPKPSDFSELQNSSSCLPSEGK
jgi:hypothetical protein